MLFQNRRFANSYYLFGYAIEIGLKSCIARQFVGDALPDKTLAQKVFTHRLFDLVGLAVLRQELESDMAVDPDFKAHWLVAVDWSEERRYEMISAALSKAMRDAVVDDRHGVMRWLRQYW